MAFVLVVVAGPDTGTRLAIDADGMLGRGAAAAYKLADPTISREHCGLAVRDDRIVVTHAGGNPTLVNGAAIAEHVLAPGDLLTVGETTLQYVPGDGGLGLAPAGATRVTLVASREARAYLGALARLADDGRTATTRREVAEIASRILREALGARRAAVYRQDREQLFAELGASGVAETTRISREVCAQVLRDDTAVVAGDAGNELIIAPAGSADLVVISGPAMATSAAALELVACAGRMVGALLEVVSHRELAARTVQALRERVREPSVTSGSAASRELDIQVRRIAGSDATVLVLGESGVGKEVCAGRLHRTSKRSAGPFVGVNCAAIALTLIESELFGHERGAFTGAADRRIGRFEQADGGTLFLDEIGELDLRSQAKLLRILEERRFERVGGTQTIAVDVRVVAATNRDLSAEVSAGAFRADLFHRLNVLVIEVPPLRARADDIIALAMEFLDESASRAGRDAPALTDDAVALLRAHLWPGNIRELRNVMERAVVLVAEDVLDAKALRPHLRSTAIAPAPSPGGTLPLEALEKKAIVDALAATNGNKTRAAAMLGIDRTGLYKKLRRFGLES